MIAGLQEQIIQKDLELSTLNMQLLSLNKNIDSLNVFIDTITADNRTKTQLISDQITKLQTAFYVVGTYKELRDKNVLNKEGGFLDLEKNKSLKMILITRYLQKSTLLNWQPSRLTQKTRKY